MSERIDDLGDDTVVALVTFTKPDRLAVYRQHHDLDLVMLTDRHRSAYRAYGLDRGSLRDVWGPKAARRYLELFKTQGLSGLRKPVEDTLQLGGDFVVGPDGTLVYGFWGEGPHDRPPVDDLVDAVTSSRH